MKISEWEGKINTDVSMYTELQALIGLYQLIEHDIYRLPFDIEHDIVISGEGDVLYKFYDGFDCYDVHIDGKVYAEGKEMYDGNKGMIGEIKLDEKIELFN